MSNQQVGMVYDRVIQEVCEASQVDFEEGGVDQQTLEDMRRSWQQKLSHLGVAHFPWDPPLQPTPPPQPQNPILPPAATVPSNAPRPTPPPPQPQVPSQPTQHAEPSPVQTTLPGQVPATVSASTANGQGPQIKTEPGANGQHHGLPTMTSMPQGPLNPQALARERAMNNLNHKYGAAAANSVSQLQAQSQAAALSLPGQQRPQNAQVPNGLPQDVKPPQAYQNMQQSQRTPFSNSQTDGADEALLEWKAEVARRRETAQRQNGEGDRLLMEQIRLQALRLEGGGLMLPLEEHLSSKVPKRRARPSAVGASGQYDGPDDDEKADDEDAINSDLDDPDDLVAEEHEGEDAVGQVMLCTYDKVQRVKNKWKCTLKDGILATGGKEYVFHKGQGEFEW
ncbi:hypothetical protein VTN77DRAFT_9400 [Rasamsonia byssochlamydoides]|uniref:uncharacterized protein n=1 Tax=Rasamsonia byssochlamydoides TaxID=89139 RepID=UPI0037446D2F